MVFTAITHNTPFSSLPLQALMAYAIKAPLLGVARLVLHKMPHPTKENIWHPNSHNLIEIRDEFLKHCKLDNGRKDIILAIFNFVIILYDYDPPWRWMMDFVKDMAFKMEWKPRGYDDTWASTYKAWWEE